jgi:archaemetzincin
LRKIVQALLLVFVLTGGARAEAPPVTTVCFQPLGRFDKNLLKVSQRGVEYLYAVETRALKRKRMPKAAYYPPRKRHRADKLLDHLEDVIEEESQCDVILGFTSQDISVTKGRHKDWGILGLGSIGGRVGVISSFRMRKRANRTKQKHRAVKVTNHELGHVFGAPHGGAPGCVMNDAEGTIRTVDKEKGLLCPESRAIIERRLGRPLPRHTVFEWRKVL